MSFVRYKCKKKKMATGAYYCGDVIFVDDVHESKLGGSAVFKLGWSGWSAVFRHVAQGTRREWVKLAT